MDRDPADQRRATLRTSDADREQFVEALRRHHAEGRLTTEERTECTGRAYAARTFGGYFWPVWPILGFLLAIAGQFFYVYGPARPDDDRPRDR